MTETMGNPMQELSSINFPSFGDLRRGVVNKINERRSVEIPTPTREELLQKEVDKQMETERRLLQENRSLSVGDFETRIEERRRQLEGRLMLHDERFQGMVTQPGVTSGYRPVDAHKAPKSDAQQINERLDQYEGGSAQVDDPRETFRNTPSPRLQEMATRTRMEQQMPTVEELTRVSPLEEARAWLAQYNANSDSANFDITKVENYIIKRYGKEVWDKLFPKSSSNSS